MKLKLDNNSLALPVWLHFAVYTQLLYSGNFDRGKYWRIWRLASNPSKFSLSIFLYSKYRLSKRLSINISPVKLLNEANPSIFPAIQYDTYHACTCTHTQNVHMLNQLQILITVNCNTCVMCRSFLISIWTIAVMVTGLSQLGLGPAATTSS